MGNICFGDKKVENDGDKQNKDNDMGQTKVIDSNVDQKGPIVPDIVMPLPIGKNPNYLGYPGKQINSDVKTIHETNDTKATESKNLNADMNVYQNARPKDIKGHTANQNSEYFKFMSTQTLGAGNTNTKAIESNNLNASMSVYQNTGAKNIHAVNQNSEYYNLMNA